MISDDEEFELTNFADLKMENFGSNSSSNTNYCASCNIDLSYPHIECAECTSVMGSPTIICLQCFSKGREFGDHKNDHNYVVQKNIPLFTDSWKYEDELQLLKSIHEFGFGNWTDVCNRVNDKTAEQCKQHYMDYYINDACDDLNAILPTQIDIGNNIAMNTMHKTQGFGEKLSGNNISLNTMHKSQGLDEKLSSLRKNITHRSNEPLFNIDDPPRPSPETIYSRELAHYNAARSDFGLEYANDGESLMQEVEQTDHDWNTTELQLLEHMQMAFADMYRRIIAEREWRKRVIKEHGIIEPSRAIVMMSRHKSVLPPILADTLASIYPLMSFQDFTKLVEGLNYERELKGHIYDLKKCRVNGLSKQAQVPLYEALNTRREAMKRRKRKIILGSQLGVGDISEITLREVLPVSLKRVNVPLDITGAAEYETLNEEERDMASYMRLLPTKFNRVKKALITECIKLNGLTLANARTLLRVDVNKVRRIYDYLLDTRTIFMPS